MEIRVESNAKGGKMKISKNVPETEQGGGLCDHGESNSD